MTFAVVMFFVWSSTLSLTPDDLGGERTEFVNSIISC